LTAAASRSALRAARASGARTLAGAASRRAAPFSRPSLSPANRPDQGFDLAADSDVIRALHRPLLNDHNVDVPFIDLNEFQRELCRLEKGRAIAGLPGPSPTRDREQGRRDLEITQVIAPHLGDLDRFERDLFGFRQHA
jgi:hypothetical protein